MRLIEPSQAEGVQIEKITLKNKSGMQVDIANFGAAIMSIKVPDKDGVFQNVALGFDEASDYPQKNLSRFGVAIGRYANRISDGKFSVDGNEQQLSLNKEPHHMHGGNIGFDKVLWQVEDKKTSENGDSSVTLSHVSKDGEEGYAGELNVKITYVLTHDNKFKIKYQAETNKPTVLNLTNHSYFNLGGENSPKINNNLLQIHSGKYAEVDDSLLPTGKIASVEGTIFDFRKEKCLKEYLDNLQAHSSLSPSNGFDHYWFADRKKNDDKTLVDIAEVFEPSSGIGMKVKTTEAGAQIYTGGNIRSGIKDRKSVADYLPHAGICIETGKPADSPNHSNFPNTILRPNEVFESETEFEFYAGKEHSFVKKIADKASKTNLASEKLSR